MEIPVREVNIDHLINKTFGEVSEYFMTQKEAKLLFSKLLKEGTKLEKIYTFIPLLHLSNEGRVILQQATHLGEIEISLGSPENKSAVQNVAATKSV